MVCAISMGTYYKTACSVYFLWTASAILVEGIMANTFFLSYDIVSGSEIKPCNKIDNQLVVYRFSGNVMTSITTLQI